MSETAKPESKASKSEPKAAKPETAKPEPRLGGKIVNAPVVTNTGGYELKVAPAKPEVMAMAGHNQGGFENRVTQEAGAH